MRFHLKSLFVLMLVAALGLLAMRFYLNSRPVVGQVITISRSTGIVEVSIGANDGATVGQLVDILENDVLWCRARIVRTSNDTAIAEIISGTSSPPQLAKCDRVVLRPGQEFLNN